MIRDIPNSRAVSLVHTRSGKQNVSSYMHRQPSSQQQTVRHTEYCRLMIIADDVEGFTEAFELPEDLLVGTTNCSP